MFFGAVLVVIVAKDGILNITFGILVFASFTLHFCSSDRWRHRCKCIIPGLMYTSFMDSFAGSDNRATMPGCGNNLEFQLPHGAYGKGRGRRECYALSGQMSSDFAVRRSWPRMTPS